MTPLFWRQEERKAYEYEIENEMPLSFDSRLDFLILKIEKESNFDKKNILAAIAMPYYVDFENENQGEFFSKMISCDFYSELIIDSVIDFFRHHHDDIKKSLYVITILRDSMKFTKENYKLKIITFLNCYDLISSYNKNNSYNLLNNYLKSILENISKLDFQNTDEFFFRQISLNYKHTLDEVKIISPLLYISFIQFLGKS
jgi:hypothetical protein